MPTLAYSSYTHYNAGMAERDPIYLQKAVESLRGASSEHSNERYQNSVNRSYYATFQAAVHALLEAGFTPPADSFTWSHSTPCRRSSPASSSTVASAIRLSYAPSCKTTTPPAKRLITATILSRRSKPSEPSAAPRRLSRRSSEEVGANDIGTSTA
jgi:hypothetical protein